MIMVCSTSFEFCSVLLTTKAILFFFILSLVSLCFDMDRADHDNIIY